MGMGGGAGLVPSYWLTEGGQSATGALLDHLVGGHVAAQGVASKASENGEHRTWNLIRIVIDATTQSRYRNG